MSFSLNVCFKQNNNLSCCCSKHDKSIFIYFLFILCLLVFILERKLYNFWLSCCSHLVMQGPFLPIVFWCRRPQQRLRLLVASGNFNLWYRCSPNIINLDWLTCEDMAIGHMLGWILGSQVCSRQLQGNFWDPADISFLDI